MPMIVEITVAMLACARIGAVHSIVVSENLKTRLYWTGLEKDLESNMVQ